MQKCLRHILPRDKRGKDLRDRDSFFTYLDELVTWIPIERELVPKALQFYYIVKGVNWAISELLDGSPYEDTFRNGIYMHSFLYVDDYHRYHVPVGGVIKEVRNIHGRVYMDVFRQPNGTLDVVDGDTYRFRQERGLIIIDSPKVGMVAVLPIGMAYVSSVNLTPEVGANTLFFRGHGLFKELYQFVLRVRVVVIAI